MTPPERGRPGRADDPPKAAPADLPGTLTRGAEALGLVLSEGAARRLLAYVALLGKWGAVYNLTAIRDPARILVEHVLVALAIDPVLRRHLDLDTASVADVGSGAGLPGLPLAIVHPTARLLSIEPVGKKIAFQRQVCAELALTNVELHAGRAEGVRRPTDLVLCRAFASLAAFLRASAGLQRPGTLLAAMKGRRPEVDDEVAALPGSVAVEVVPVSVPFLEAHRHLVLMRVAAPA